MPSGVSPGLDDARRDAERPGGGGDQERVRFRLVAGEIALAELVLDEPVGGRRVRHPQQRLGEDHQGEPLLGGERIFPQHLLDAAEAAALRPDRLDEARRRGVDPALALRRQAAVRQQAARDGGVVLRIGGIEDGGRGTVEHGGLM